MPELLTGGIKQGAERAFTITELRRVASGSGKSGLIATGVKFVWTAATHSIPRGSWNFGIEHRTNREDYAGGEEPIEQMLGWNYTPFTLTGCWDDRYGGSGYAESTRTDFENLIKRGNPVRLEFENLSITGVIKNCEFGYKRRDLIEYKFQFSPHNRTENETVRPDPALSGRATMDPRTVAKLARQKLEAVQAAQAMATAANLSQVQSVLSIDVFSELNSDLDEISGQMAAVDNIVNDQIFKAESAANAFLRATQIFASVKTSAASAITRIQSISSAASLGVQTAVTTLDFESWHRGLGARLRELVVGADDSQKQLKTRTQPAVKKLHRAREGESLYAISNYYYGTPHRWREIAERNGLTALLLDGGELLVIPE